jgi:DNA-binding CsgD family transcriptional regulator/tetratricopeptide (TPR) repeat protein
VLGWSLEQGDAETGLRMCTSVRPCWIVLGAFGEGAEWFDAFLAADLSGVPAAVHGQALVGRAQLALGSGDAQRAEGWAAAGLELCRAAGDPYFTATALNVLAETALHARRPELALERAGEAAAQARQAGDQWNEGYALGSQAAALAALFRLEEARASAEAGLALMLAIDQQWGAARTMLGLADLARLLGDLTAAREHYRAALTRLRQVKGDPEIARCLAGLGRVALDAGDLADAREYLAQGLRLSLGTGSRTGIARGLLAFATLSLREGDPGRAVQLAAAVMTLSGAGPAAAPGRAPSGGPGGPDATAARVQRYLDEAAVLGEAVVARLWVAGLELTSSAAADLALAPRAGEAPGLAAAPGPEPAPAAAAPAAAGAGGYQPPAWPEPGPPPPAAAGARPPGGDAPSGETLTPREWDVVTLIAQGRSNKAIAEELFISPATAARHVANILGKLGFSSRSQVAAWAARGEAGGQRAGRAG